MSHVSKMLGCESDVKSNVGISLNQALFTVQLNLLFFGDFSAWQDKDHVIYSPTQEILE